MYSGARVRDSFQKFYSTIKEIISETISRRRNALFSHVARRLSGVWSGTTLRRASVQLSKPSVATYTARLVGQPGCGCRLPQPGQLTLGEELLGYHNNNNINLLRADRRNVFT